MLPLNGFTGGCSCGWFDCIISGEYVPDMIPHQQIALVLKVARIPAPAFVRVLDGELYGFDCFEVGIERIGHSEQEHDNDEDHNDRQQRPFAADVFEQRGFRFDAYDGWIAHQ